MNNTLVLESPPDLLTEHWQLTVYRADLRMLWLLDDHYSTRPEQRGKREQYVPPCDYVSLMTADLKAGFVWSHELFRHDGQKGVCCMAFRNTGEIRSSLLIEEAMYIGQQRWSGERFFTYVDPNKIRSTNPGCCFKKAGWKTCGESAEGLHILEWIPGL